MRPSVLITRATFPDVVERLRAHADVILNPDDVLWRRAELIERLRGKVGRVAHGSDRVDAELLDACPQLRFVCSVGVGDNHIDVAACTARGVLATWRTLPKPL